MAGEPTTAGCRAVSTRAGPASVDAACLTGARAAGARIVGRTNLHELALGVTGVNPWYGTPVNPLDPSRVPGGSSSGSAVAVATGEADVAYGSDTGGSVRIPAACCGTTGLKTTWGRIPLGGVRPLAPSLDTVGPMARDVAGLVTGWSCSSPGSACHPVGPTVWWWDGCPLRRTRPSPPPWTGRCTWSGGSAVPCRCPSGVMPRGRPACCSWPRPGTRTPGWSARTPTGSGPTCGPGWPSDRRSTPPPGAPPRQVQRHWSASLAHAFTVVDLVVTPTLTIFPPPFEDAEDLLVARCTLPVNLAGVPAVTLPLPARAGSRPASS